MKLQAMTAVRAGVVCLALAGHGGAAKADVVFETVGTLFGGPQSSIFTFDITEPGQTYQASLTDYAFPTDSFDFLALAIGKGANLLGSVQGSGSFTFDALDAGSYTAILFGSPAGPFAMGSYGISVSAVPEAESWALLLAGLGLIGLRLKRRDTMQSQKLAV